MVSVKRSDALPLRTRTKYPFRSVTYVVVAFLLSLALLEGWLYTQDDNDTDGATASGSRSSSNESHGSGVKDTVCSIASISELSQDELHPVAGDRHMITPPIGGKVSLVCCQTTKGNMNILLHENWAPLGVPHYLSMLEAGYFSTSRIPLFRCTDACQFGLAGNVNMTRRFGGRIPDDLMWLPPGPAFRENKKGVRRYPMGFFTHAGGGQNSRSNQFVLTLQPNRFMGGGSPWEVPMGEVVGADSFTTLSKFYNGYGEKGPTQAILKREGDSEHVRQGWPLLDYITACDLVEEMNLPSK